MFVVGMSLVSLVLTDEPTGIVRVMRALRVLRIFGRLKSLRKILSALALALVPVCQVFLILFILLCIGTFASRMCHSVFLFAKNPEFRACPFSSFFILSPYLFAVKRVFAGAVVGVAMFSGVAPDNFAVFDRAFLTLFYVTGGDPWPDALPKFNEDGSANWVVAAFIMAYTVVEIWVILQVPLCPPLAARS